MVSTKCTTKKANSSNFSVANQERPKKIMVFCFSELSGTATVQRDTFEVVAEMLCERKEDAVLALRFLQLPVTQQPVVQTDDRYQYHMTKPQAADVCQEFEEYVPN
jgi:hypothetical protein